MSFEEFSNLLSDEVLSEIAENFFGARRRLDDLLDGFQNLVRKLKEIEVLVKARFAVLHYLLLRGGEARAFYAALGLDPALADYAAPELLRPSVPPRWALTLQGRYAATILATYAEVRQEVQDYMHGRSYVDVNDRGRRKITMNYEQLRSLGDSVNLTVQRVNRNMAPSTVLQYVKNFDVEKQAREQVAGIPAQGFSTLDKGLAFQPIRFESLGLTALPDLPAPETVADALRAFCGRVCADHRCEVAALLTELKQACEATRSGPGKG